MIVLIDENAHHHIVTDIGCTVGLRLGKFFTDETLLDEHRTLQCSQPVDLRTRKDKARIGSHRGERRIHRPVNLGELRMIRTIWKRKLHQVARETHTAREDDVAVPPANTEPWEAPVAKQIIQRHPHPSSICCSR